MSNLRTMSSWRLARVVLCVAIALIAAPSVWAYWPNNPPTLPAKGGKYTDPTWGTTVMRVTDATDGGDWGTAYSYWPSFNKDNTHLLVFDIGNGTQYVQHFDAANFLLVGSKSALFPTNPPGGNTPRQEDVIWSGVTSTLIYGHDGLKLWSYHVDSATWTLVKDFTGAGLPGSEAHLAQMSRSMDDNVFGFTVQNASWNYTGYIAWKRDTNQIEVNVADTSFDEVQVDKSGRYLVAKVANDIVKVYDTQLDTVETLTDAAPDYAPGHSDNHYNVVIGADNWENRLLKRNLATPHTFSTVLDWGDNWTQDSHLSCLGDDESKVAMSTYTGSTPAPDYLRDEVFLITTDGNETVTHLCHHYSHYTDYYSSPRGNVSRDQKYFAYTSNYANQGRLDLFVVQIPGGAPQPPVANFTGNPTSGYVPLTVAFTDTSSNSPTAWSWTFGDSGTSTAQNPSHQYTSAASYTVSLTATNAQGSDGETKTNYITASSGGGSAPTFVAAGAVASNAAAITPALPAGIATNDILLLFLETANQAISIPNQNGGTWTEVTNSPQGTGTAAGSGATRLTAFWSRYNGSQGAPTTSDSGNHQLGRIVAIRGAATSGNPWDVTAGGVDATADTSGSIPGATTTLANTLVVAAIATALPDASGTANFSAWTNSNLTGLAEQTDNTVTAGNGGGLAVARGEKGTAGAYGSTSVTCATAAKKGLLSIALKAGGGGGSAPVANFTGSPTSGTAPLAVSFTDTSTNTPTAWSWTFGDSSTSTLRNPSHTYAAGTYTVSLTAANAYGSDGETKTSYITATGASEVYVYPDAYNWHSNGVGTLIAGGLSDVQTSNDGYMQVRCNTSNHNSGLRYEFHTGYTPSQVNKITVEYELHCTRTDTPSYQFLIYNQSGGQATMGGGLWTTTDQTFTWNTTAVSTYMSSSGYIHVTMCGCAENSNNYDTYVDVARIKLTLN